MHELDTTAQQLAELPVSSREGALKNPAAASYVGEPLTVTKVGESTRSLQLFGDTPVATGLLPTESALCARSDGTGRRAADDNQCRKLRCLHRTCEHAGYRHL